MELPFPYALFLGDSDRLSAKTATGIAFWRPQDCVTQVTLPGCSVDVNLPTHSPRAAAAAGAKLLIVGVANFGGGVADNWIPVLLEALEAGLDLAGRLGGAAHNGARPVRAAGSILADRRVVQSG